MAQKIKVLDSLLASKIAAGEVVERPASVVKELIENSLDAGATTITVHVAEGGRRLIRVVDDGEGMSREDASIAFFRHATSKVSIEEDLYAVRTMGFRGEALSSVSAVARVLLRTRQRGGVCGYAVAIEGGSEPVVAEDGCPEGTSIEVKDLFYNTPARLKFLRSTGVEFGRVMDVFKRAALINPGKRFRLIHGSTRAIDAPPGGQRERLSDLFGAEFAKKTIEVNTPLVKGFIGSHEISYPTAGWQFIYVNGRWIRDRGVMRAVIDGYGTLIPDGRYPFVLLDIIIPPQDVDVNIHPAKTEVRFKNTGFIYDIIKAGVKGTLGRAAAAGQSERSNNHPYGVGVNFHASEGAASYGAGGGWQEDQGFGAGRPGIRPEDIKNPEFLGLDTVGQLWGEFLVAQGKEDFYVIDQHGAAERIAFERLRKGYYAGAASQMLLIPERFEAASEESSALGRVMPQLERIGFEITPFGPSSKTGGETFLVKAAPDILAGRSTAPVIKDLLDELSGFGGSSKVEERIEAALMRIACHSVIRGVRILSKEEGNSLLRDLARIDFAGTCPHGRPVVKRFSRLEIEAVFKR